VEIRECKDLGIILLEIRVWKSLGEGLGENEGSVEYSVSLSSTLHWSSTSDGSGSNIFDPGRVKFLLVGSSIFGLGMDLENFP